MHIIVKHMTLNAVVSFECRLMTCLSGSKPTNADFPLLKMLPSCHPGDYGGGSAGQRVAASSQGPPSKTGRSGGCPSSGVRGRPRLRSKTALGPRGATRGPRKNLSPPPRYAAYSSLHPHTGLRYRRRLAHGAAELHSSGGEVCWCVREAWMTPSK
jgi:hypothetical protein